MKESKDFGFFRAAAAVPKVRVADTGHNTLEICQLAKQAYEQGASMVVFPELCVTGYTCADLFGQELLLKKAEESVREIMEFSRGKDTVIIIGVPVGFRGRLYNCAAVIRNGNIKGLVPKIYLPNYNEFYEARWFASGSDFLNPHNSCDGRFLSNGKDCVREGFTAEIRYAGQRCNISPNMLFQVGNATIAVEICEDMWTPIPPSSFHAVAGAQVIANLSASNEVLMKNLYREGILCQHSSRTLSAYIYSSAGYGESTQDLVYGGSASIWENGSKLAENERFQTESSIIYADLDIERLEFQRRQKNTFKCIAPDGTDAVSYDRLYSRIPLGSPCNTDFYEKLYRRIEPHPFIPSSDMDYRCREILSLQVTGLASRLDHINCRTAVIGISGGLDSTLALIVTALAFDKLGWSRDRIVGVTMPGYGTTGRTRNNATDLMEALGTTSREISISGACDRHFQDIGHDKSVHDITYENSQARERTQILMDIANQTGGIVVGTGDLSELALGWATYNGDHMSMYGVNASIPKTLVRSLTAWAANNKFAADSFKTANGRTTRDILLDIVDTPISPELLPADEKGNIKQVTEDVVGPYELHDFFLYNFVHFGFSPEKILLLAEKAFSNYDHNTIVKWLKTFIHRFFSQQFKRSCLPDGPKVGSVTLSPRGDWRMPSDAKADIFKEMLSSL